MPEPLRIFAAGSLRPACDRLVAASPERFELTPANARDLARRIAAGEPADVFLSPSGDHPRALHAAGLAGPPRAFGSNRIVVAVAPRSACPVG